MRIFELKKITEDISFVNGTPKKLVVFLHGYLDSAPSLAKRISFLEENITDAALHIPYSPEPCEVYNLKSQWYSMHQFDPDDERKIVKDMADCVAVYDKMGEGLKRAYT